MNYKEQNITDMKNLLNAILEQNLHEIGIIWRFKMNLFLIERDIQHLIKIYQHYRQHVEISLLQFKQCDLLIITNLISQNVYYFVMVVDVCLNSAIRPRTIHDIKLTKFPWYNMQEIFESALEPETLIPLFSDALDEEQRMFSQRRFDQSVLRYLGIYPIIDALAALVRMKKITIFVAILICHHYGLVAEMIPRVKRYLYTIV